MKKAVAQEHQTWKSCGTTNMAFYIHHHLHLEMDNVQSDKP